MQLPECVEVQRVWKIELVEFNNEQIEVNIYAKETTSKTKLSVYMNFEIIDGFVYLQRHEPTYSSDKLYKQITASLQNSDISSQFEENFDSKLSIVQSSKAY